MSSLPEESGPGPHSANAWQSPDRVLHRFEAAWRSGRRPEIADYVSEVEEAKRAALYRNLLQIDADYRRRVGDTPLPCAGEAGLAQQHLGIQASVPERLIAETPHDGVMQGDTVTGGFARSPISQDSTFVPPRDSAAVVPPSQIGDYEILGEIARGGMGVVYKARHRQLRRLAAVKLIKSGQFADEAEVKRFHIEAQAAAGLDHSGIVPVYEVGQQNGQHYMALAYVDGQSLWQRVKEAPLPPHDAAQLMQQVAEAVQYAHDHGIIHRDLKPQNILLTNEGRPKLTDFGLAKRQATDSSLTATGQVLGTPSYMPPEQVSGKNDEVGPLADVYALGATLYCLLTGRPPFHAATVAETMLQVLEKESVSPRQLNSTIPRDLETICLMCLQKDRLRRYASAAAFADDLRRYLVGEPIRARRVGRLVQGWRWCRRNPVVAVLFALVFASAGLMLVANTGWAVVNVVAGVAYEGFYRPRRESNNAMQILKAMQSYNQTYKAMPSDVRKNVRLPSFESESGEEEGE